MSNFWVQFICGRSSLAAHTSLAGTARFRIALGPKDTPAPYPNQNAISGKPEQREIAQHALSIYDAATREGARTTYYEVSQIQVAQDAVSAALDGRALPASSDLITAPTLLTPSAINTVDLASVNVTANVPAEDGFFGGIGSQLAQNYRAGWRAIDTVVKGCEPPDRPREHPSTAPMAVRAANSSVFTTLNEKCRS